MNKIRSARLMAIASMVIFGTIGIFRKFIPLPSGVLAMARGYVGAALLLLVLLMSCQRLSLRAIRQNAVLLFLSGAAMGFNWILLFESYSYTSVATATLCYYMAPVFLILAAPIVLGERLTLRKLLCAAVSLVGIVLVSGVTAAPEPRELIGVALGLGAAVLYASVILMNKRMRPIPALDKTVVQLACAAVVLNFYSLFAGEFAGLVLTPGVMGILAIVCILHTGIAYLLYFRSMEHLPGQSLALLGYIDPVVAVAMSALILHEKMTLPAGIGAILVLTSAVVSEFE